MYMIRCGHYSRVATIKGVATIQGWLLVKGGCSVKVNTADANSPSEAYI